MTDKKSFETIVAATCKELFAVDTPVELTRPDPQFGDYATNVALRLAKELSKPPREIADLVAKSLREKSEFSQVDVAGPGFINLRLSNAQLLSLVSAEPAQVLAGKTVVAEYSDPNPFKVLHAGHLYTSVVGDAIANLLERVGATVHRVNFGGDVGLHVGKTMWAIIQKLGGELPDKIREIPEDELIQWMSNCYVVGTNAYEEDESAKQAIIELNKKIYKIHEANDHESNLAKLYWLCREWNYSVYFASFYESIGTSFEKYYPESVTAPVGLQTVKEQLAKGVYTESNGAVVFDGEKYGLHTRVFINSEGLPTYEAEDVGLIIKKDEDYHFDLSVVITGNEIVEYMKVVLKSVEQFAPELVQRTRHVPHGMVKLEGGTKMSSRKGNILRATDVLEAAADANKEATGHNDYEVELGAVKYAFLKNRIGGDLIYNPKESVSLDGNSGPYLQYAHARARSILAKKPAGGEEPHDLDAAERQLVGKLSALNETIELAVAELMPHHICNYLYELAQEFNRFYEHNRVIDDPREATRLWLVANYADALKQGLATLGIHAPDHM
ncbi:MAG: arginine--tRNA ligase [Candidatus Saccharibacteria bacterium]|nr:arginine--tRNA ligase [Candidatus Saccharibacteria bacterium]